MRFVIYDDATLEPITVVNISGFGERDIEEHGCRYRLSVPPEFASREVGPNMSIQDLMRFVELKFEHLIRVQGGKTIQETWMCFTKQEELALLLTPGWLPGQRGAVEQIQQHNEKLTELLMNLIMGADR